MVCLIMFILFTYSIGKQILKILYTLSYPYIYPVVWNLFLHAINRFNRFGGPSGDTPLARVVEPSLYSPSTNPSARWTHS